VTEYDDDDDNDDELFLDVVAVLKQGNYIIALFVRKKVDRHISGLPRVLIELP
jgi:hypothetical protein